MYGLGKKRYSCQKRCLLKFILYFFNACIFLLPFLSPLHAAEGTLKVHFIDVGYGDAIFVELPDGQTMLIDAGDESGADRLTAYLVSRGVRDLDAVILTHPHKNHFGGFFSLIKKWPIGEFYINGDTKRAEDGYADLMRMIEDKKIPVTVLKEGDELFPDGSDVRLVVLHPSALKGSANENALVLRLIFKETSFLLTADIQRLQQDELFARYPEVRPANGVQVPHHGGRITDRFAGFFGDKAVFIVSTGQNKYGKPFAQELDKLKGKVFRTDLHGTIVLQSNGYRVEVSHE